MTNIRFGLKLWSINVDWISTANKLIDDGVAQYVEIMPIPGSNHIDAFSEISAPIFIHANTDGCGVNIADKEKWDFNISSLKDDFEWADKLNARSIILHPGWGDMSNAVEFLISLNDNRLLIENMPKIGLGDEAMIGYSPSQMKKLMGNKFGMCLDLNHAVKAATSLGVPYKEFVRELCKLKPSIFHISDGILAREKDEHLKLGDGEYDIQFFINCVKSNPLQLVTLETPKKTLTDDLKGFEYLKRLV